MRSAVLMSLCVSLGCGSVDVDPLSPRHCRGVRTLQPDAPSGTYVIDGDGPGGAPATAVECDFSNGGTWVVVRRDGFETSAAGFSRAERTSCGAFGTILGGYQQFGNEVITLEQPLGTAHTELRVRFDFVILDSWDGELVFVEIDGARVWTRTCDKGNPATCNQVNDQCGWDGMERLDGRLPVEIVVPHTAQLARISFGAVLDQSTGDESWGIDDLAVSVR